LEISIINDYVLKRRILPQFDNRVGRVY
jgi:hypothetical protein